ncbi:lycopene cyclase family protein [Auraticoccus cholistanensis]|uniref:lycopene cyclase family protein n=1 Tax=Auraticoccus cholistanensis TaxID=2656650 RepID=UPI002F91185B
MADVVVLGLGPSGRALASRLARRGLEVVACDPAPDRRWTPTYAAWADELPSWLEPGAVSTRFRPRVRTRTERVLEREYVVLSTARLQDSLRLDGVTVLAQRAVSATAERVRLADGTELRARYVLDARGASLDPARAQQTAVGVVVSRASAERVLGGSWLMDWRPDHGAAPGAPASFLYAVALDEQDTLLEETCLVGRPALGMRELRQRLETRLAGRGIVLSGYERVEHVRFSVEPEPGADEPGGPVAFGARGGLMHPATGYSVAVSLREAETVATAVAAGGDPRRALWPAPARAARRLRQAGLRTLLSLSPAGTVAFFEAFFDLPVELQRGYLSERADPARTLRAMATMAGRLPLPLTGVAVRSTLVELASSAARPGR